MRGLPVDVELEVLVLVHEAAARLEDGEVGGVLLREQVRVVAVRQLRLHLDRLQANLQTNPEEMLYNIYKARSLCLILWA